MNAKLATVDDRIAACVGGKPGNDDLRFACGYLSPYFITAPERMEVAFENV